MEPRKVEGVDLYLLTEQRHQLDTHHQTLHIGTVIVLLIWLNLSAMSLIMGAEVNGTLMSLRKERSEKAETH